MYFNLLFQECGLNNGAMSYRQPRTVSVGGGPGGGGGFKSRLVNGKETQKGAWPWQVSTYTCSTGIQFIFYHSIITRATKTLKRNNSLVQI